MSETDASRTRECESPVDEPVHIRQNAKGERRTWIVVILTFITMVAEVGLGYVYNSMALMADGWHMGSHVAAFGITLYAYWHARHHRFSPRFSFGTGKVGALGGFASGATLGFVAFLLVAECIERALHPEAIRFNEALMVATLGLGMNLLSAFLLSGTELGFGAEEAHGHGHGHGDDHGHGHGHGGKEDDRHLHGHDHNLRAAYLHVLADAMTSILAIFALLGARNFGWTFLDPIIGIVASFVILRWTVSLLRQSSVTLLDQDPNPERTQALREDLESDGTTRVSDLHVWMAAPGVLASMITVVAPKEGKSASELREVVQRHGPFTHLTIEVRAR